LPGSNPQPGGQRYIDIVKDYLKVSSKIQDLCLWNYVIKKHKLNSSYIQTSRIIQNVGDDDLGFMPLGATYGITS